jgi:hypothetical protein
MLISVFDLWILIDRCNLCVPTVHCGGTSRYNTCKNQSNTGSPCASLLNENPLLCHEADAALGTTRCIEETNGDEYKNITTRNCCPWMDYAIIAAVHHEHHSFYDDTTNQLLRSDFCIHWDFARITIGVHDGCAEMA